MGKPSMMRMPALSSRGAYCVLYKLINGKHVRQLGYPLARTSGIPDGFGVPVTIMGVEGLPLCGNFEPHRATITKCALLAHLFIHPHSGEECH